MCDTVLQFLQIRHLNLVVPSFFRVVCGVSICVSSALFRVLCVFRGSVPSALPCTRFISPTAHITVCRGMRVSLALRLLTDKLSYVSPHSVLCPHASLWDKLKLLCCNPPPFPSDVSQVDWTVRFWYSSLRRWRRRPDLPSFHRPNLSNQCLGQKHLRHQLK